MTERTVSEDGSPPASGPQSAVGVRLRVLLTDAHELAALGAVRSLGRAGHRVTAAYPGGLPAPAATRSRHCAGTLRSPEPWQQHLAFRRWLRQVAAGFDVVLPLSEAAIVAAAAVRRELAGAPGPLWLLPSDDALRYTLSKYQATLAAQRLGLCTPPTAFVCDGTPGAPFEADLGRLRFPLVVKIDNHTGPGGVYRKGSAVTVSHRDEVAAVLAECRESGAAVLVQELVPGHGTGAFLLRHGGEVRLRFAHERLHEVPWTGGFSSLRRSIHDAAMLAQAEGLLAAIGYDGVAMVEFRRGAADGRLYFLEINGRLWGSLALALHAGCDFPLALLEANLGRPAPAPPGGQIESGGGPPPYPDGLLCRNVFPGEILYLLSVLRARPAPHLPVQPDKLLAVWEFLRLSLDPRIRHDHFWWSDPRPGLTQALGTMETLLGKAARHALRRMEALRALPGALRLASGAERRLGALPAGGRVLFLCYGNICRSPFAAAYWNRRLRELGRAGPEARSAGFHPVAGRPVPPRFAVLSRSFGVELADHRSRAVTLELLRDADAIFIMDQDNARALSLLCPAALPRTFLLGSFAPAGSSELADPFGLSPVQARLVYEQMVASLEGLLRATLT